MIARFHHEYGRHFLWLPVFFGIGITVFFALSVKPHLHFAYFLFLIAAGLLSFKFRTLFLPLFFMALGFVTVLLHAVYGGTPMIYKDIFIPTLEGKVIGVDDASYGKRLLIEVQSMDKLPRYRWPKRVKLTLRGKRELLLLPGDQIKISAVLTPVMGAIIPGGFDFKRKAYFNHIGAYGFVTKLISSQSVGENSLALARQKITHRLWDLMPGEAGTVASALITGDTSRLSQITRDHFADSGIAHILAISGLHLNIVGGFIFLLLRLILGAIPLLALRFSIRKISAALSIVALFGYLQLSGMAIPCQRSFVMASLVMLAILVDRNPLSMRFVCIAALIVLIFSPEVLMTPSFQLSFAAVMGLIGAYENSTGFFLRLQNAPGIKKFFGYFLATTVSTVIASLATLPFTIFHFYKFTLQSIPANLIGIPVMGFWVMPLGAIGILGMPFGLEKIPLMLMGWGIDIMCAGAAEVSSWPGAIIRTGYWPAWGFLVTVFGGLWMSLWKGPWRRWGAIPFVLGFFSLFFKIHPEILLAPDGKMGMVKENVLYVSSKRTNGFTYKVWLAWLGLSEIKSDCFTKKPFYFEANGLTLTQHDLKKGVTVFWKTKERWKSLSDLSNKA